MDLSKMIQKLDDFVKLFQVVEPVDIATASAISIGGLAVGNTDYYLNQVFQLMTNNM